MIVKRKNHHFILDFTILVFFYLRELGDFEDCAWQFSLKTIMLQQTLISNNAVAQVCLIVLYYLTPKTPLTHLYAFASVHELTISAPNVHGRVSW